MISTVRRALDRCAVVRNCPTEHLRLAAAVIITRGIDGDVFENVEDTHALIAAVVAFANVAPIEVLEQMADIAERERCYAEWWDARGYDESIGAVPELGYDYEAMRAEASVH